MSDDAELRDFIKQLWDMNNRLSSHNGALLETEKLAFGIANSYQVYAPLPLHAHPIYTHGNNVQHDHGMARQSSTNNRMLGPPTNGDFLQLPSILSPANGSTDDDLQVASENAANSLIQTEREPLEQNQVNQNTTRDQNLSSSFEIKLQSSPSAELVSNTSPLLLHVHRKYVGSATSSKRSSYIDDQRNSKTSQMGSTEDSADDGDEDDGSFDYLNQRQIVPLKNDSEENTRCSAVDLLAEGKRPGLIALGGEIKKYGYRDGEVLDRLVGHAEFGDRKVATSVMSLVQQREQNMTSMFSLNCGGGGKTALSKSKNKLDSNSKGSVSSENSVVEAGAGLRGHYGVSIGGCKKAGSIGNLGSRLLGGRPAMGSRSNLLSTGWASNANLGSGRLPVSPKPKRSFVGSKLRLNNSDDMDEAKTRPKVASADALAMDTPEKLGGVECTSSSALDSKNSFQKDRLGRTTSKSAEVLLGTKAESKVGSIQVSHKSNQELEHGNSKSSISLADKRARGAVQTDREDIVLPEIRNIAASGDIDLEAGQGEIRLGFKDSENDEDNNKALVMRNEPPKDDEKQLEKAPGYEGRNDVVVVKGQKDANLKDFTFMQKHFYTIAYNAFGNSLSETERGFELSCCIAKNPREAIHALSHFKTYWDLFMSCTYIVGLILIPMVASFPKLARLLPPIPLSVWFSLVFISDSIVNWYTLKQRDGTLVYTLDESRRIFLKKSALLHLVCAIPLVAIDPSGVLLLTHLPRMFEVYIHFYDNPKFQTTIQWIQRSLKVSGGFMSLFILGTCLLLFLHFHACAYFLFGNILEFHSSTWQDLDYVIRKEWHEQYAWAAFAAVGNTFPITGYRPSTAPEQWITILMVLVGGILYAVLVGTVSSLSFGLDSSGRMYKQKMDEVNEYMNYKKLDEETKARVREFYELKFRGKYFDETRILNELNLSLRQDIAIHNCQELIQKVSFLQRRMDDGRDENFTRSIASALQPVYFIAGDRILEQGQLGNEMYFIYVGEVDVVVNSNKVGELKEGGFFGELALLDQVPRTATIKAQSNCILYLFHRLDFEEILKDYEDMNLIMQQVYEERMEKLRQIHLQYAK